MPGTRVYVLGPPQDEELLLGADDPRRDSEVYQKAALALDPETAFFAAALAADEPPTRTPRTTSCAT